MPGVAETHLGRVRVRARVGVRVRIRVRARVGARVWVRVSAWRGEGGSRLLLGHEHIDRAALACVG